MVQWLLMSFKFIEPKDEGGCPSTNPSWQHVLCVWPKENNKLVKLSRNSLNRMHVGMQEDLRQYFLTYKKDNPISTYAVPAKCWMRYFLNRRVPINIRRGPII